MGECLLSIVVPHYGTPDLLQRCVASLPQRGDVQLIVIEDTFQRGAGWARNVGLEQSVGKWVTFVDADDFLPEDYEQILEMIASRDEEDILMFRNKTVMSEDLSRPSGRESYEQCFSRYFNTGDDSSLRYQMCSLWGKYFKRSFIEKHHIRFDEVKWSNDTFFSLLAGYEAKKIAVFKQIAYVITEHAGSLTSDDCHSMEEWHARYEILLKKRDFLLQRGKPEWADEYMWMLKKLLFIDIGEFVGEMKRLYGTSYFYPTVKKVFILSVREIKTRIFKPSCRTR